MRTSGRSLGFESLEGRRLMSAVSVSEPVIELQTETMAQVASVSGVVERPNFRPERRAEYRPVETFIRQHDRIIEMLDRQMEKIEQTPLTDANVRMQQNVLKKLYPDIQGEYTALHAVAPLGRDIPSYQPLFQALDAVQTRWHVRNNAVGLVMERLYPRYLYESVDLIPEVLRDRPRNDMAEFDLPKAAGGNMKIKADSLHIEKLNGRTAIVLKGDELVLNLRHPRGRVIGVEFDVETVNGSGDWVPYEVLHGRDSLARGLFKPGMGTIKTGGMTEEITRVVFTPTDKSVQESGIRITNLRLVIENEARRRR